MSEKEIIKRREYKQNRKKWLVIQAIALAVAVALALCSFLVYDRMNRTYYIEYTENSSISYQVEYRNNDFFADQWVEEEQAYISPLMESVLAKFRYEMRMDADNVGFDYAYSITARMTVADKDSGKPYYTVEEELVPERKVSTNSGSLVKIDEQVTVDFPRFNEMAREFTDVYGLHNADCALTVTLDVQVLSACAQFEQSNENHFATSLNMPLNVETVTVHRTAAAPTTENKVLACDTFVNKQFFLVAGFVTAGLALLLALTMMVYMHLTKNEDITYTARVRRILNSYGSFIQRIEGEFAADGYQVLTVKTFEELLGIRDTLQAPVLMTENRDQTMSRFLIPTDTMLLYVYDIKVDNYNEIYGISANSI